MSNSDFTKVKNINDCFINIQTQTRHRVKECNLLDIKIMTVSFPDLDCFMKPEIFLSRYKKILSSCNGAYKNINSPI